MSTDIRRDKRIYSNFSCDMRTKQASRKEGEVDKPRRDNNRTTKD